MSTILSRSLISIPDFTLLARSIKAIKRNVPPSTASVYTYFADTFKIAASLADDIDRQITESLTSLPVSVADLKNTPAILLQLRQIDEAEQSGKITPEKAAAGRAQLQTKLATAFSSTINSLTGAASKLSDPVNRLARYAQELEIRLNDAVNTETANLARAKQDVERESARLKTLEDRYNKLVEAVDAARGGPTENIAGLLPDKDELASLVDIGAADAAAPEVAAAKKAIELAIEQMKKMLDMIDKTITFVQLTEMRDQVYKAVESQRTVLQGAQERLKKETDILRDLDSFRSVRESMNYVCEEAGKLSAAFSSFASALQSLPIPPNNADTLQEIINDLDSYLNQARSAHASVILG